MNNSLNNQNLNKALVEDIKQLGNTKNLLIPFEGTTTANSSEDTNTDKSLLTPAIQSLQKLQPGVANHSDRMLLKSNENEFGNNNLFHTNNNQFLVAVANTQVNAQASLLPSVELSTSAGDGGLSVTLDAFGSFGSYVTGDAFYDPIGLVDEAGTTFESAIAIRVGDTGSRTFLSTEGIDGSGELANPGFTSTGSTNAQSSFSYLGLDFNLDQTVSETFENSDRTGSLLTQTYTITNPDDTPVSFDLVRYLDGDLIFDGSLADGGGLLTNGSQQILFETDTAGESDTSSTFVGITGEGGVIEVDNRFELDKYSGLVERIINGDALDNIITGDGADADQFVDAGFGFDITLALRNVFTLNPGESTTYTTSTIFGSGVPEDVVVNPESDSDCSCTPLNQILGTPDRDLLNGTDGNDSLEGRQGRDTLIGGAGSDLFVYSSIVDAGDIINDFEVGQDKIVLTEVLDSFGYTGSNPIADGYISFAPVASGTLVKLDPDGNSGSDAANIFLLAQDVTVAELDDLDNFIFSADMSTNEIVGTPDRDLLEGTDGNDEIIGLQGRDTLIGGEGCDRFVYTSIVDAGDIIEDFEVGHDQIDLFEVLDSFGYSGSDPIADGYISFASIASGTLVKLDPDGNSGSDAANIFLLAKDVSVAELDDLDNFIFSADMSTNEIVGTPGRDLLEGTDGNDEIIGLQGRDTLIGGAGCDRFVYTSIVDAGDIIEDFEVGHDQIDLFEVLDSFGYMGSNPIADGYISFDSLTIGSSDDSTLVKIDPDGNSGSDAANIFLLAKDVSVAELNDTSNFVF